MYLHLVVKLFPPHITPTPCAQIAKENVEQEAVKSEDKPEESQQHKTAEAEGSAAETKGSDEEKKEGGEGAAVKEGEEGQKKGVLFFFLPSGKEELQA